MAYTEQYAIQTARLTKVFRDFWLREKVTAVCDLDLEIERKQVFGLLGPNGSGKSTAIKMILGLLFPTSGVISVFGKQPTNVAIKSRIGFLPEESYLYPFLNAFETLEFYGQLFHQPRRERHKRIEMLLDMVGLTSVAYRRVGEYSKGMQRRIGLAQALINDPDLLILDEPTSGMDPIGTKQFKDLISTLAMRGKTVLLSSHLLGDVEDVCDRVSILYGGRQRASGTIEGLLAKSGLTQLTVDKLSDDAIEKLSEIISQQGGDVLDVSIPRDKLESLFLRIVSDAQQQKVKTGGAIAGGRVAEFLRHGAEDEGRAYIEQLVSPKAERIVPQPVETELEPVQPQQETADEILEELVSPEKKAEEPKPAAAEKKTPKVEEKVQADQSVIDQLLSNNGNQEN